MIDHLLRFTDEAEAIKNAPQYRADTSWRTDIVIPDVRVYTLDGNGKPVYELGWFLWVALPSKSTALDAGTDCFAIVDRDKGKARQASLLKGDMKTAGKALFVSPVIFGSDYQFGPTFT